MGLHSYAETQSQEHRLNQATAKRWIAKFGVAGFLFFTIKGLLWLAIPALIVAWQR